MLAGHFFQHRWEEARAQARTALSLPRGRQGKAFALTLVALASAALDEDPTPELREAERLYRLMEGPYLARFLGHRATLELGLGRCEEAERDALESMTMARELGDRPGTCKCLLILAQVSSGSGYAREALELGKSLASRSAVVRALALLVRDLARSGSVNEASEVLGHLDALPALPAHARETLDLVLPARATRLSELVERALAQGSALQLP